jgi:hypothetical protein
MLHLYGDSEISEKNILSAFATGAASIPFHSYHHHHTIMGTMHSDITEADSKGERCFGALPSIPILVGRKFATRPDACIAIDLVTPKPTFVHPHDSDVNPLTLSDPTGKYRNRAELPSPEGVLVRRELYSMSKRLDIRGIPNNEFILMHPNQLRDPSAEVVSERTQNWEHQPSKSLPITRIKSRHSEGDSRHCVDKVELKLAPVTTTPRELYVPSLQGLAPSPLLRPSINSDRQLQSGFPQVKNNVFIPIHDDSDDDESRDKVLGSRSAFAKRDSNTSTSIPSLTLKRRKPSRLSDAQRSNEVQCGYMW